MGCKFIHCMTATLHLNLGDALTAEELRELTAIATAEGKPLERVLFEAAQDRARRRRGPTPPSPTRTTTALPAAA